MRPRSLALPAVTAILTAALFTLNSMAQTPQAAAPAQAQAGQAQAGQAQAGQAPAGQAPPAGGPPHSAPAPTNLQVLPKNMTGEQVHQIMHKWEADLGVQCSTCHTADTKNVGPNGRPRMNFADDSKEEKQTARLMYKMTEDINANYVSKIPSSDQAVTCGTCHRGHLGPEPFVAPKEDHDHDHPAPPSASKP